MAKRPKARNNWQGGYPELFDPGESGPKRRYIPSPQKIREWAMASSAGGRFICPICKVGFSVSYGIWGKRSTFEPAEHYCKDCAKENNIRRLTK